MRVLYVRALIVIALACCVGPAGAASEPPIPSASKTSEPQKSHAAERASDGASETKNSDKSALLNLSIFNTQATQPSPQQQTDKGDDGPTWKWVSDAIIAIATAALAIITGRLVIYTKALWRTTEKTLSASTLTDQRQLRAYLGVLEATVTGITEDHIQAWVTIKNTGQTPARGVVQTIKAEIRQEGAPANFPPQQTDRGPTVIVPGGHIQARFEIETSETELLQVRGAEKRIFVWGSITYIDIFDQPQTLAFRYRSIGEIFRRDPSGRDQDFTVGWELAPEADGNTST